MPNRSKIRDPRMWARWRKSGAVGTLSKLSWLDLAGDTFERLGFMPGCIWEAHDQISPAFEPGVIIATLSSAYPTAIIHNVVLYALRGGNGKIYINSYGEGPAWEDLRKSFRSLKWS